MQIIMQNLRKGSEFYFYKISLSLHPRCRRPLIFHTMNGGGGGIPPAYDNLYICTNLTLIQLKEDLNLPRRPSSEFPDFGEGYKDTQSNKGRIQGYTV